MLFLLPADYFDIKQPDPDYATEYETICKIPEFKPILFNYDEFVYAGKVKLHPQNYYTGDCIYRGWMLNPSQYKTLYSYLSDTGIKLINTPTEYNACHIFPNVLSLIEPYTPKSLVFPNHTALDWELVNKTFTRFMVKDYVKSVKDTGFPPFFETPVAAAEMDKRIAEFIELRGNLFTGGIVLKDYVDFKQYNDTTNEYRAFYLQGQLLSLCRNSKQPDTCRPVPHDFVNKFANLPSNYYTVDFAELADDSWIVVETGDGQVSGLSPGQFVFKYYDDVRYELKKSQILTHWAALPFSKQAQQPGV